MRPVFKVVGLYPDSVYEAQQEANIAAGYRSIQMAPIHDVPLAVVGGGPSIKQHVAELISWPGHIWGINQSAQWLLKNFQPTCPVWMFTADPDPRCADFADGVEQAILGGSCHPLLFEKFDRQNVRYFLTRPTKSALAHYKSEVEANGPLATTKVETFGPSSVTRTFMPALMLGYKDVTYFGCEGSIDETTLEANACRNDYAIGHRSHKNLRLMIIRAGDKEYVTTPDYYITTTCLADVMKAYPKLKEKSGGLLRAMIEHEDWSCVAVSEQLRNDLFTDALEPYETKFDVPAERYA